MEPASKWVYLYAFLAATFVIHCVAFLILGIKKRKPYYFALTATFVFLTAIYVLKTRGLDPAFSATGWPIIVMLRVCAISCTITYLVWIARMPGTWLSRLIGRG